MENSTVNGANFSNVVNGGFDKNILYATTSWKQGDLSAINLSENQLQRWDLSNQNLQNADFTNVTFVKVDFTNSDLRGAIMDGSYGTTTYKNTILSDGTITNFSMTSSADNFSIREYVPATTGGAMISAKFTENASLSGDSTLTLEKGAQVEVTNNSLLTFGNQSSLVINTDANSSTMITIADGAGISFEDGSKITINLVSEDPTFNVDGVSFSIMSWVQDNLRVQGLENFKENENVFLTINDVSYNDVWDFYVTESQAVIKVGSAVPEPAEWAVIFGAVALGFVAYRRLQNCEE